jgi:hypothetical protein
MHNQTNLHIMQCLIININIHSCTSMHYQRWTNSPAHPCIIPNQCTLLYYEFIITKQCTLQAMKAHSQNVLSCMPMHPLAYVVLYQLNVLSWKSMHNPKVHVGLHSNTPTHTMFCHVYPRHNQSRINVRTRVYLYDYEYSQNHCPLPRDSPAPQCIKKDQTNTSTPMQVKA